MQSLYYKWSKEFLEAGKKRLSGDTEPQATSGEVKELRREMGDLKEALADVYFGRGHTILLNKEKIKRQRFEQRRLQHQKQAA